MTLSEIAIIASQTATALVIEDRDADAKAQYELAAKLYAEAGDSANSYYMTECANAL